MCMQSLRFISIGSCFNVWVSRFLTEFALLHRPWKLTELGESFRDSGSSSLNNDFLQFTIATYNVLAQNLLEDNRYLYRHCEKEWLMWPYRQEHLLAELIFHQPDVSSYLYNLLVSDVIVTVELAWELDYCSGRVSFFLYCFKLLSTVVVEKMYKKCVKKPRNTFFPFVLLNK